MKHLYVIGNGFDIFTGLKTRYQDFRKWLKHRYVFVYEALESAYGIQDIEWWSDFEVSLGKLDVNRYVYQNTPPPKTTDEIIKEMEEKRNCKIDNLGLPPSLSCGSPCADRLAGLLDILQYCMRKWILSMTSIENSKELHLEKDNSIFLTFNYTETLELLYRIPKDQILHIHGCAYENEKLIFGHNMNHTGISYLYDGNKVGDILDRYYKNPYEYIYKHPEFFQKIKDVKYIHIYGLSFSPIDIGYLDYIFDNTPNDALCEVSWYSKEDIKRINEFILSRQWKMKDRLKMVKLIPVEE